MGDTEDAAAVYDRVSARAASLGVAIAPEELAELAVRHSMGGGELAALDAESEANATDYQKLMEIDARKQALNAQLEALYEAWEALCE